MLHAGGKFGGGGYKVSGGLHGVGVSVVNALVEWLEVEVQRDGKIWHQRYERGVPVGAARDGREVAKEHRHHGHASCPTPTIFETIDYDFDTLAQRLRELAFLNSGLRITSDDERARGPRSDDVFHYEGGIARLRAATSTASKDADPPQRHLLRERDRRRRQVEVAHAVERRLHRVASSPSPTTSTPSRAAPT